MKYDTIAALMSEVPGTVAVCGRRSGTIPSLVIVMPA